MELDYIIDDNNISLVISRKKKCKEQFIKEKDFDKLVLTNKVIKLLKGKIPEKDFCDLVDNCFNKYEFGHYKYDVDFNVLRSFLGVSRDCKINRVIENDD
jgi:hypothetical protein